MTAWKSVRYTIDLHGPSYQSESLITLFVERYSILSSDTYNNDDSSGDAGDAGDAGAKTIHPTASNGASNASFTASSSPPQPRRYPRSGLDRRFFARRNPPPSLVSVWQKVRKMRKCHTNPRPALAPTHHSALLCSTSTSPSTPAVLSQTPPSSHPSSPASSPSAWLPVAEVKSRHQTRNATEDKLVPTVYDSPG